MRTIRLYYNIAERQRMRSCVTVDTRQNRREIALGDRRVDEIAQ